MKTAKMSHFGRFLKYADNFRLSVLVVAYDDSV